MRILVTGGAGFIGSHLCEALLRRGCEVIVVDDLSTGTAENLEGLPVEVICADVAEPLPALHVDRVFNLACPASPPRYQRDPIRTWKTSTLGTLQLLELAERCGARFVQASTSEVYGDPLQHPQAEDYFGNVNPVGIRACYDEGKRAAEALCFDFRRARGVDVRVARIFNTYGPRMQADDGRVVSNFVAQALRGEPLTVYGDGTQTRSLCYVDDLVGGLLALMEAPSVDVPLNLGNPEELQVGQLASAVLELTGSASPIVHRPLPSDDPLRRRPDITRARTLLGWEPKVPLRDGLARTIAAFASTLN